MNVYKIAIMENKTLAILALVFAFFFPIVGLILGIIALVQINKSGVSDGKGLAIAAIIVSVLWAIIPALVVIGSLAYFGVLSPTTLLPERCALPVQFNCLDYRVTSDSVTIVMQNGAGRAANIQQIEFGGSDVQGQCVAQGGETLQNGERRQFVATGCNIDPGDKTMARIDIDISYAWEDSPTLQHSIKGALLATVD